MLLKRLLVLALTAPSVIACGGAPGIAETPSVESADDQIATCKVAKDPLNPMVVEWPGTSKVDLEAASQESVVVVSYKACTLKVLSGCAAKGKYDFVATTPTRDEIRMASRSELYAHLPLGAAALRGEVESGSSLKLEYVAVGQRIAKPPASLHGECEGATHFVRTITVGAYQLDAQAAAGLGVEAGVGSAGAGAKHKDAVRRLRSAGDVAACTASKGRGECGAVLQLGLVALADTSVGGAGDAGAVSESGKSGAGGKEDGSAMAYIKAQKQGYAMRESAMQRYNAGDAAGCLKALDQADKVDPDCKDEAFAQSSRAMGEFLAGQCAAGKRRYAAWLAKWGGAHANSPEQVSGFAEQFSRGKCK